MSIVEKTGVRTLRVRSKELRRARKRAQDRYKERMQEQMKKRK